MNAGSSADRADKKPEEFSRAVINLIDAGGP